MQLKPITWNIILATMYAPILIVVLTTALVTNAIQNYFLENSIAQVLFTVHIVLAIIFLSAYFMKDEEGYVSTGGIIRGTIISLVFGFLMDAATGGTVRKGILDLIGF